MISNSNMVILTPEPGQARNQARARGTFAGSFQDVRLNGQIHELRGFHSTTRSVRGYGLDLDGDGQFQGDRDGILAFDIDGNGNISEKEIDESNQRLKVMRGSNDLDGDGKVGKCERRRAKKLRKKLFKQYDRDGDGKLNNYEFGGAKVLVDSDGDGRYGAHEAHQVDNVHTRAGWFRVNQVDPRAHFSDVSRGGWGWSLPPTVPPWACHGHW